MLTVYCSPLIIIIKFSVWRRSNYNHSPLSIHYLKTNKMSTVQISASDVNKLRQQTGAGMMDCKKALTETNGDFEAAIDFLRKKGAKVAASRQDRESNEGVVIARTSEDFKRGVVITVNCETDFVAKNAEFIAFGNAIANEAIEANVTTIEELYNLTLQTET